MTFVETHLDSAEVYAIANTIQRAGIWSCPTIVADEVRGGVLEDRTQWPELRYAPPEMISMWDTASDTHQLDSSFAPTLRFVRAFQLAGAGLLSGTDAMDVFNVFEPYLVPGFSLHNTRTIRAVVANGHYFDRAALDTLLTC